MPKRDLIAEVQTLLKRGELRIARDLKGARMLLRGLMDVQARAKSNGGMRVGADGNSEHDDLLIDLVLGCWKAKRRRWPRHQCFDRAFVGTSPDICCFMLGAAGSRGFKGRDQRSREGKPMSLAGYLSQGKGNAELRMPGI